MLGDAAQLPCYPEPSLAGPVLQAGDIAMNTADKNSYEADILDNQHSK